MNELPIITILTLLPLAGGVIALALGRNNRAWARHAAIGFGGLALVIAVGMWLGYDAASGELGFEERHAWVPSLNIEYRVAADGLGVLMLVLTALVTLMAIVASGDFWKRVEDTAAAGSGYGSPLYYALILFLQAGLFGTFTALNFFHWFIFWELSLVPAFFLIRLWGGFQRSEAATQFFVYTMVGSIALLLSFLALFLSTGEFDFTRLAELGRKGELIPALAAKLGWFDLTTQQLGALIFCGALLGFAVKVPLLPFHTWLPATYTEAPTPVTMLLTGVMSKMGVYGFVRILLPIFGGVMHWQTVRTILLGLAAATVVFSACAAFAQKDLKRILAYSSINHLGY
ncbi:MAG TPA: NADH-quinone oxidoreductase subunit M, partial [Verrucomicrobiota bacterium]|nr:NADH-quinone oxidoreductase subunit M [Verrucomicrobiota bacterium]